jgi:hypothetical protein
MDDDRLLLANSDRHVVACGELDGAERRHFAGLGRGDT